MLKNRVPVSPPLMPKLSRHKKVFKELSRRKNFIRKRRLNDEVNETVEEWKDSSHTMEKNRDSWRKRAMDLEKKLYCKQCLGRQKEVKNLNDDETMELCAECTERFRSTTDMQERLKFLETQIKHWQNSSVFESTRYLQLMYKIHCDDCKSDINR